MIIIGQPIATIKNSLGKLAIFQLSAGNQRKMMESLGTSIESCDPDVFTKHLIMYICYPEDALNESRTRPNSPILSLEDIDKLSDEEIELIIAKYLDNSPSLIRKNKTVTNENGESVIHIGGGEIEYPKEDTETYRQYVHRLYTLQEKKIIEQMSKLTESLIGTAHFSNSAIKSIKDSLAVGNSLKQMIQGIKFPNLSDSVIQSLKGFEKSAILSNQFKHFSEPYISLQSLNMPQIDYAAIEKNRRAPFESLGERLDQIIDLSEKTIEFANTNNKMQIALLSDIKSSGESSSNSAKKQGYWTITGVILTIIVITMTGYSIWLSYNQSKESSFATKYNTERVVQSLTDINHSVIEKNTSTNSDFTTILTEIKDSRISQNAQFNRLIDEQTAVIKQLNDQRIADQRIIEELKQKLTILEKIINNNAVKEKSNMKDK
jgi:hypothetical protein